MKEPTAPDVQPEGTVRNPAAILAGEQFRYDMVSYAATPEAAVADTMAWANRPEAKGAGSALYGPTVAVRAGEPYRVAWAPREWRVPMWWQVAATVATPDGPFVAPPHFTKEEADEAFRIELGFPEGWRP